MKCSHEWKQKRGWHKNMSGQTIVIWECCKCGMQEQRPGHDYHEDFKN